MTERTELPPCPRGPMGLHQFPVVPVNAPCLHCSKTALRLMEPPSWRMVAGPLRLTDSDPSRLSQWDAAARGAWFFSVNLHTEATLDEWADGPFPDRRAAYQMAAAELRRLADDLDTAPWAGGKA